MRWDRERARLSPATSVVTSGTGAVQRGLSRTGLLETAEQTPKSDFYSRSFVVVKPAENDLETPQGNQYKGSCLKLCWQVSAVLAVRYT